MKIETGQSGETVYFFQRQLICIYFNSQWTLWSMEDKSFKDWWNCYVKVSGKNGSEPWFQRDFGIDSFRVNGNKWTLRLHTGTSIGDWSYGLVPAYVYAESNDFGKSWKMIDNCKFPLRLRESSS
jgi:hypothetical protein